MSSRARKQAPAIGIDATERIEEVAARWFILHGYNGVSYLQIARDLGITHSNIHYYYRTKAVLAEAVLRRVAETTLGVMKNIWTNPESSLFDKFIGTRDWVFAQYLLFNPDGKGTRPWGLLSRFSLEANSLTSPMKQVIRSSLDNLENYIAAGVRIAVKNGELNEDTPQAGITLQIATLIFATGQVTRRYGTGLDRYNELLRWTHVGIMRAYGSATARERSWPALPRVATEIAKTQPPGPLVTAA